MTATAMDTRLVAEHLKRIAATGTHDEGGVDNRA
jgi:hypothetical protein